MVTCPVIGYNTLSAVSLRTTRDRNPFPFLRFHTLENASSATRFIAMICALFEKQPGGMGGSNLQNPHRSRHRHTPTRSAADRVLGAAHSRCREGAGLYRTSPIPQRLAFR